MDSARKNTPVSPTSTGTLLSYSFDALGRVQRVSDNRGGTEQLLVQGVADRGHVGQASASSQGRRSAKEEAIAVEYGHRVVEKT